MILRRVVPSFRPVFKPDDNPYAKPRYDATSPPRALRGARSMDSVHQPPPEIPMELLNGDAGEGEGTRRSTRQKKLMYSTYNMSVIDKQLTMLHGIQDNGDRESHSAAKAEPYRKRRKVEVEIENVPQEEVSRFELWYTLPKVYEDHIPSYTFDTT